MFISAGHFMVIYDKGNQKSVYVDGREMAPHLMTPTVYQNLTGENGASLPLVVFGSLHPYNQSMPN